MTDGGGEARRRASSIGASQAIGLVEMYGGDRRTKPVGIFGATVKRV